MRPLNDLRLRFRYLLLLGIAAFAVGVWLRLEARELWSHNYHMPGTSGTDLNALYVDEYKFDASVDIARVLMGLGATVIATAAAAWLFVPAFRPPPSTGERETGALPEAHLGSVSLTP